jgi:hypothetical protein
LGKVGTQRPPSSLRPDAGGGEAVEIGLAEPVGRREGARLVVAAAGVDQDGVLGGLEQPRADDDGEGAGVGVPVMRREPACVTVERRAVERGEEAERVGVGIDQLLHLLDGDAAERDLHPHGAAPSVSVSAAMV